MTNRLTYTDEVPEGNWGDCSYCGFYFGFCVDVYVEVKVEKGNENGLNGVS
jgi:hypothetical protein